MSNSYTISVTQTDDRSLCDPIEVETTKMFSDALRIFTTLSAQYIENNTGYEIHMTLTDLSEHH